MKSSAVSGRDDETILLLYLADELSPVQKQEIERRLTREASFAAALERLGKVDAWLSRSLDQLDQTQPLPGTAGSWQRRVGRMIHQWQARQAVLVAAAPLPGRRVGGWAYAAAAVALLVIGYTAYWGFQSDGKATLAVYPPINLEPQGDQIPNGPRIDPLFDYSGPSLADADRELRELSNLRASF